MIKQRVKKVTYQVWEECECGGRLECSQRVVYEAFFHSYILESLCQECGKTDNPYKDKSPRYIEEYEEINE